MGRKEENLKDFALGGRRSPGGLCSHHSSPRRQLRQLSSERPVRDSHSANTPICNWQSAPSSRAILVSYSFIIAVTTTTTKFTPSTNTLLPGLACRRRTPRLRSFMITRLLASGARLYFAAIALALAYEMISGNRPNQTQTLVIYVRACIAIRDPNRDLHDTWRD